jgi:hypothetical protein
MGKYRIISSAILVEWNDNPKMETLLNTMPSDLQQLYDEWLSDIENERNATSSGGDHE